MYFFRVALFPSYTFFTLYFFHVTLFRKLLHVALISCCTLLVLLFFILYSPVILQFFSSCTFFVLQSCQIVSFFVLHCSTFFVFIFFMLFLAVPFPCCILIFQFFQVALFSCFIFFILRCFTFELLQLNNFRGALFSCRTIFCVAQFHVVPFRTLFTFFHLHIFFLINYRGPLVLLGFRQLQLLNRLFLPEL